MLENFEDFKLPDNKYVIAVDDDEFQLNAISTRLSKKGIKCLKCINGEECVSLIANLNKTLNLEPQIIVFSDIDMPKMNGLQMAQAINKLYIEQKLNINNINIVYISSDIVDGKLTDKYNNYFTKYSFIKEYFSKPINNKNLFKMISELIIELKE